MANLNQTVVHTEDMVFFYGEEGQDGSAPSKWYRFEPNNVPTFSPNYTRTARNPLGGSREVQKGELTGEESNVGIEADITISSVVNWLGGYQFCDPYRSEAVMLTPVSATATTLRVAGDVSDYFPQNALISVKGLPNTAGESVLALTSAATATGGNTTLTVSGQSFPTAAADVANILVSSVGLRVASTVTIANVSGGDDRVSVSKTGLGEDLQDMGLREGFLVYVKTPGTGVAHGQESGYGYVESFTDDSVTLRGYNPSAVVGTVSSGNVDILFSIFAPNRNRGEDRYKRSCYQFGQWVPGIGQDITSGTKSGQNSDIVHFLKGNLPNTLEMAWTAEALATTTLNLMGLNADMSVETFNANSTINNSDARIPQIIDSTSGGVSAPPEIFPKPVNTTKSFARLRLKNSGLGNSTALDTVFESINININNNATRKPVVNKLGAYTINVGSYDVQINGTALYQDPRIQPQIVEGTDVSFEGVVQSEDGAFALDFPFMTLSDGSLAYPEGDIVNVTLTGQVHRDQSQDFSVGISAILTDVNADLEVTL